jgi:hypothetical protein
MKNVGWEIRPLGWLVIALLVGFVIYLLIKMNQRDKPIEDV